jgi:hypothetical protein
MRLIRVFFLTTWHLWRRNILKSAQGTQKLKQDLEILERMAAGMEEYLKSDVLFWTMGRTDMPQLTLGGYLMRQRRLLLLRHLLDEAGRVRLDQAINQYKQALVDRLVRWEQKAHQELEARLRQWQEHLRDIRNKQTRVNYATAAEVRTMIAAFLEELEEPPYQLDANIPRRLNALDRELQNHLQPGGLIWPEEWQPAYPREEYWWLYGRPR